MTREESMLESNKRCIQAEIEKLEKDLDFFNEKFELAKTSVRDVLDKLEAAQNKLAELEK